MSAPLTSDITTKANAALIRRFKATPALNPVEAVSLAHDDAKRVPCIVIKSSAQRMVLPTIGVWEVNVDLMLITHIKDQGKAETQAYWAAVCDVLNSTTIAADLTGSTEFKVYGAKNRRENMPVQTPRGWHQTYSLTLICQCLLPTAGGDAWETIMGHNINLALDITTGTALRALPTLNLTPPNIYVVTLLDGNDMPPVNVRLVAGTYADDAATFWRPDDFNALTNAKVWMRT
jgi:hypothetical protein